MAGILEYSSTPASNTTINGIGISGSSSIKYGDDAIRQFMADVRSAVTKASDKAAGTHMATKADHNQLWRVTGSATINLTSAATLTAGWALWVMADGGTVTIDPASSEQINGAATLTLSDGNAAFIICTATAFRAVIFNGPVIVGTTPGTVADGVAALQYKGAIGAAEDLDTYTTPGIYVQNQISGASGGTNYPVANAGMLEVLDGGGATNVQTVQRYTEYSQPPIVWQRMRRNGGNWSAWLNLSEWMAETVSQVEAEAGTATDRRAWTAERVKQAIEASPASANAWVNFDGTGTVTIRRSYNVSSIADNGVGDYTANFATPLPNDAYAAFVTGTGYSVTDPCRIVVIAGSLSSGAELKTTTQLRIISGETRLATKADMAEINLIAFGG